MVVQINQMCITNVQSFVNNGGKMVLKDREMDI